MASRYKHGRVGVAKHSPSPVQIEKIKVEAEARGYRRGHLTGVTDASIIVGRARTIRNAKSDLATFLAKLEGR